jgi:hypothetical protein
MTQKIHFAFRSKYSHGRNTAFPKYRLALIALLELPFAPCGCHWSPRPTAVLVAYDSDPLEVSYGGGDWVGNQVAMGTWTNRQRDRLEISRTSRTHAF